MALSWNKKVVCIIKRNKGLYIKYVGEAGGFLWESQKILGIY